MIQNSQYQPLRLQSDELVLEELSNEFMIYDPSRKQAFCLNETAAFVWRHADGKTSVEKISRLLSDKLNQPVDEQVVWYALETLSKDGLLASNLPEAVPGISRRTLLRRFGVGAAASVPLVTALMVAPAKAHASTISCDPGGNGRGGRHQGGNPWWWWW